LRRGISRKLMEADEISLWFVDQETAAFSGVVVLDFKRFTLVLSPEPGDGTAVDGIVLQDLAFGREHAAGDCLAGAEREVDRCFVDAGGQVDRRQQIGAVEHADCHVAAGGRRRGLHFVEADALGIVGPVVG
jgi:hypothetical protein